LVDALDWPKNKGLISKTSRPIIDTVSAVSVGVVDGIAVSDLEYVEDVRAETDMNVVVTGRGLFVEVQGTAEAQPFSKEELDQLLELAVNSCAELAIAQREALGEALGI
jgi:ribonuclease PH